MRTAATAVLTGATVLLLAGPALAATGDLRQVSSEEGRLTVVLSADGLAEGVGIDPASVRILVNGDELPTTPADAPAQAEIVRTAVLVIDTSGSMRGAGITGATAAARTYVQSLPDDVRLGLVGFSDAPTLLSAPTTDHAAVLAVLDGLTATGETSLYDAVGLALEQAGADGIRNIVVLSDGGDTSSGTPLADLLATTSAAGVQVDTVGFQTDEAVGSVLQDLAVAGAGQSVAAADARGLTAAFAQAAQAISTQVVAYADIPSELAGQQVTVRATGTADGDVVFDEAVATLGAAAAEPGAPPVSGPQPVATGDSLLGGTTILPAALVAVFVGLSVPLVIGAGALNRDPEASRVRRRLSLYTLTGKVTKEQQEIGPLGGSAVARSAMEMAGRVVEKRDLEARLGLKLERAGVPLRPAEWLLIQTGAAIGLALLGLLLSGGGVLPTVLGLVFGLLLPLGYLSFKQARRTKAFLAQMPDTLQLLAGSLSAGYSLPQALDAVVREGSQPISGEFNRALVDSRLGVPIEDALDDVATRMGSKDFGWVVMAVRIQREVGGNLAEVLSTVAQTMRERERVRRQVQVLSAEGKLSAYILGGLPPVFGLYLTLVRPEYIAPLFTDPIGIAMLVVMTVLFLVGVVWMRKVVTVEV